MKKLFLYPFYVIQILIDLYINRLGRCKRIEDVSITGTFDPKQIRCNLKALEESLKLEERANKLEGIETSFFENASFLIAYVNVRSLNLHWQDVMNDHDMMKCDVIGLGETWLKPNDINIIDAHPFTLDSIDIGRGKGLASLTKKCPADTMKIFSEKYSILLQMVESIKIIFVYFSQNATTAKCIEDISNLLGSSEMPTILIGDTNIHYIPDKNHPLKNLMESKNFKQLIKEPTHLEGHIIDHVYANQPMLKLGLNIFQKPVIFSDHDEIFIRIN